MSDEERSFIYLAMEMRSRIVMSVEDNPEIEQQLIDAIKDGSIEQRLPELLNRPNEEPFSAPRIYPDCDPGYVRIGSAARPGDYSILPIQCSDGFDCYVVFYTRRAYTSRSHLAGRIQAAPLIEYLPSARYTALYAPSDVDVEANQRAIDAGADSSLFPDTPYSSIKEPIEDSLRRCGYDPAVLKSAALEARHSLRPAD